MKGLSEGKRMFWSVMAIFVIYAIIFIVFDDFDRRHFEIFDVANDWHLVLFSILIMSILGVVLYRYSSRMDERIKGEQDVRESNMRRELTQNIAHELKTPVASIMGYSETLIDNPSLPPDIAQRFITRTHEQAKRLSVLLQDLATLNRMDYGSRNLETMRVNVSDLVADVILDSQFAVARQEMTVNNCLPEDIIVEGNPSLLYSVFRNLIDNAINYAGRGSAVDISATREGNFWNITVADNGKGVPEEYIARIFERFYTIDRGRSRELGGTGLGLAIVKNAIMLHGGMITASKATQGGLRITFTLPKYTAG